MRPKPSHRLRNLLVIAGLFIAYAIWAGTYHYDNEKAARFVTEHAESRSHCCCAWYVMRAMQAGGCPIGILPAWAYRYALPFYGFSEIPKSEFVPQKGDIVVFPYVGRHIYGHIAMWDGQQWVSDFVQKDLICSSAYKETEWRYYRKQ